MSKHGCLQNVPKVSINFKNRNYHLFSFSCKYFGKKILTSVKNAEKTTRVCKYKLCRKRTLMFCLSNLVKMFVVSRKQRLFSLALLRDFFFFWTRKTNLFLETCIKFINCGEKSMWGRNFLMNTITSQFRSEKSKQSGGKIRNCKKEIGKA